jgi:taurine dioxygenase
MTTDNGSGIAPGRVGYAIRINELDAAESDRVLETIFQHQLQPKFRYVHTWTEGDVLMWDHIRTIHMAVADYTPDEPRLMMRCQVLADRVFDESFTPGPRPSTPERADQTCKLYT